jgi:O-antigen ligase
MLSAPWRSGTLHIVLGPCVLLLTLGVYFSLTRSALLALGPGLLAMGVFVHGWRRAAVIGVLIAAPVLYVSLEGTGLLGDRLYKGVEDDQSAASHLATIQVGFEIALDHWLTGIGHESFEESSTAYAGLIGGLAGPNVRSRLGEAKVHNDYLNVWFSWGIAALIAYLAVFVGAMANCIVATRSRDWLVRGLAIGCAGGIIGYAVGSATHNYLDAGIVLWLLAGISAALVPLTEPVRSPSPHGRIALLRGAVRAPARSTP